MAEKKKVYTFEFTTYKDWVIAYDKKQAIELHSSFTGLDLKESESASIYPLTDKELESHFYTSEGEEMSFEIYLDFINPKPGFFYTTVKYFKKNL